jgi:xanthine dehydrogenase accessory factor
VDVLIEPHRAAPPLAVMGDAPAARTLRELAAVLGWQTTSEAAGTDAVVIASMGRGDEEALEVALASGAGYVGLVASARRAAAVTAELRERGVDEEALARIHSPAGLDLGPLPQAEIAVAILAELVAWRHLKPRGSDPLNAPESAIDPICGMIVAVEGAAHTLEHEGTTHYFCGPGCLRKFEAAHV